MTNPKQLFVAQVLINKVKIKVLRNLGYKGLGMPFLISFV